MNNVTTATSFPSWCRHSCQHGQKCEAQEVSWSRTHKQLEAWLRPRPRITGSSAEKLALIGGTSACWVQDITESTEGGALYRLREGFSFFLANSHNRREQYHKRFAILVDLANFRSYMREGTFPHNSSQERGRRDQRRSVPHKIPQTRSENWGNTELVYRTLIALSP